MEGKRNKEEKTLKKRERGRGTQIIKEQGGLRQRKEIRSGHEKSREVD